MHLPLLLAVLATAPVSIQIGTFSSDVEALSSARLEGLMRTALTEVATTAHDTVNASGTARISGRFAAGGSKHFRLSVSVAVGAESSVLAYDFESTSLGDAGAHVIATAVMKKVHALAEVAQAAPVASTSRSAGGSAAAAPGGEVPVAEEEVSTSSKKKVEPNFAENAVYAEGLGAGLFYSVNYERVLFNQLVPRIGFGYVAFGASAGGSSASTFQLAIPIGVSWIGLRSGKHALETGLGVTIRYGGGSASAGGSSASGTGLLPAGWVQLGYRYHPVEGAGFHFRIGAMAMIGQGLGLGFLLGSNLTSPYLLPWGYISFGAAF